MASPRGSTPTVSYRHHAGRGEHQIGVKIAGVFVPFAVLDEARVAQLVEHAKAAAESDHADDGEGGE